MRTHIRRLGLVAGAAAVVLGAAACTPSESGAAAIVGDRRVTTQDLESALDGLRTGNPEFAQVQDLDRLVLFDLVAEPYLVEAAQAAGLGVSPSEAQAALPQTPDAAPAALRALQAQIALNKLNQGQQAEALAAVGTRLREAGVRVSPRFGRFDAQSLSIVDGQPNWLVPAATPAATTVPTP